MAPSCHVNYQIRNANIKHWPFPHFFVENVFPQDFYDEIQQNLPSATEYSGQGTSYHGRQFADPASTGKFDFLNTKEFLNSVVYAFRPWFQHRYPDGKMVVQQDLRLIMDGENYHIGPHTDAAWKVISLLFYLPKDSSLKDLGTSLYLPKDRDFHCSGGPHYKHELFDLIATVPFLPNSCLGFFKTDYSFHGVEPITIPCRRDVLLWNLYDASHPGAPKS